MGYRVNIRGLDAEIEVEAGETILDAALRSGLAYPFGCQSGNCGACKTALLSGSVELAPYSEFALEDGERLQGLILGCRAVPHDDCEVALLEMEEFEVHPARVLDCRVVGLDDLTHDIKRVRLEIVGGAPLAFSAGQYASLEFPGLPARDYSMANRPDEPVLEFHIRLVANGAVTHHVRDKLKLGDGVRVKGPMGTSSWRRKHTGPIVAIAGGSGMAPIASIVETALANGARQPIKLYVGARAERDLYRLDRFAELAKRHPNLEIIPVLSEPDGPTTRRTGLLKDIVYSDLANTDGFKAYLAGPPIMVETCVGALIARGMRRGDCHADAFYTEAEKQALMRGSPA
jgi:naphthalene 1,2-dioxygenase ferredoxin reductase component